MNKKKIYVGCSLTDAPKEFIEKVNSLKEILRSMGFEVLDFLGLTEGSCEDVAIHDIQNCVRQCDLFLAICDLPSTGLGIELGDAGAFERKTLAVAHVNAKVTRLVQGYVAVNRNFVFTRYTEFLEDVPAAVSRIFPEYALKRA